MRQSTAKRKPQRELTNMENVVPMHSRQVSPEEARTSHRREVFSVPDGRLTLHIHSIHC